MQVSSRLSFLKKGILDLALKSFLYFLEIVPFRIDKIFSGIYLSNYCTTTTTTTTGSDGFFFEGIHSVCLAGLNLTVG